MRTAFLALCLPMVLSGLGCSPAPSAAGERTSEGARFGVGGGAKAEDAPGVHYACLGVHSEKRTYIPK